MVGQEMVFKERKGSRAVEKANSMTRAKQGVALQRRDVGKKKGGFPPEWEKLSKKKGLGDGRKNLRGHKGVFAVGFEGPLDRQRRVCKNPVDFPVNVTEILEKKETISASGKKVKQCPNEKKGEKLGWNGYRKNNTEKIKKEKKPHGQITARRAGGK